MTGQAANVFLAELQARAAALRDELRAIEAVESAVRNYLTSVNSLPINISKDQLLYGSFTKNELKSNVHQTDATGESRPTRSKMIASVLQDYPDGLSVPELRSHVRDRFGYGAGKSEQSLYNSIYTALDRHNDL